MELETANQYGGGKIFSFTWGKLVGW
jgi:hypothetical protein